MIRTLLILALLGFVFYLVSRLVRLGFSGQGESAQPDRRRPKSSPEDPFCEKDLLELSADRQSLEQRVGQMGRLNSQLFELIEHGSAIGTLDEMVSLLAKAIRVVGDYMEFDELKLFLFDETGVLLEISPDVTLSSSLLRRLEEAGPPMSRFSDVVENGREIGRATYLTDLNIVSDLEIADLSGGASSEGVGNAAVLVTFIGQPDQLIGLLVAADSSRRLDPKQQAKILETLGTHITNTIRNVRMYHLLQERVEELNETRNKLNEATAARASIISAASHELKTPLASIRAYARTLERSIGSEDIDVQRRFLRVIDEESERLMQIVEEILSLSRLEKGRIQVRFQETDIGAIIHETCGLLGPSAEENNILLVCETGDEPVVIEADPGLIRQLLMNLLSNAIKFTGKNGRVTISLWENRSRVELAVADTGIGIPKDELDRIFDEFYQVDNGKRPQSGSGLGLAICNDIVKRHEGTISVDSREHGGTKFTVSLPKRQSGDGQGEG
jgi:signal transduction histidine kinase